MSLKDEPGMRLGVYLERSDWDVIEISLNRDRRARIQQVQYHQENMDTKMRDHHEWRLNRIEEVQAKLEEQLK